MKQASINANVISSLLKSVIVRDIIRKVKQVKKFPIRPKAPIIHTTTPEE